MSSMILGGCIPSPKKQTEAITVEENPNMMYMLVGSYATPEEEGIKVYNFDEQNGNSQYISGIKGISNPSFLIPSADGERIYAVGEDSGKSSTANAIKFDKEQKRLTLLNSQPTDGGAPCYITLSPSEKFVLTANYMGGSITVFPLDKDGKLKSETRLISFTGNSLDKERQTQPHLHCIEFTPDHKYLLASDLGTDQIHVFPVSENVTDGVSHSLLNESEEFNIKVESGSGPRHICFHPNQKFAYLINEISGKVIAFSYDKGKLNTIQYIEADTVGAKGKSLPRRKSRRVSRLTMRATPTPATCSMTRQPTSSSSQSRRRTAIPFSLSSTTMHPSMRTRNSIRRTSSTWSMRATCLRCWMMILRRL